MLGGRRRGRRARRKIGSKCAVGPYAGRTKGEKRGKQYWVNKGRGERDDEGGDRGEVTAVEAPKMTVILWGELGAEGTLKSVTAILLPEAGASWLDARPEERESRCFRTNLPDGVSSVDSWRFLRMSASMHGSDEVGFWGVFAYRSA